MFNDKKDTNWVLVSHRAPNIVYVFIFTLASMISTASYQGTVSQNTCLCVLLHISKKYTKIYQWFCQSLEI